MDFKFLLPVFGAAMLSAQVFAADTNLVSPDAASAATLNALLQIQEQLHNAQLDISNIREKSEIADATNTTILAAQIQSLEQTIAVQHANDIEYAHRTQELMLITVGVFGLAGLSLILVMFYFQWRGFSHLAEITTRQFSDARRSRSLVGAAAEMTAEISAPTRVAIESSNTRLLTVVERLEKRVLEMEQSARGQLSAPTGKTNGHSNPQNTVASLLDDGQTLLNANQPENALKLFEQALAISPDNAEVFVKKGGALEKLGRTDEAVGCYDRAIQLDETMTIAYLQKGGLFSRLARYDEALLCYEQALMIHDKAPATKSVDGGTPA